jgi:hypothetical protein
MKELTSIYHHNSQFSTECIGVTLCRPILSNGRSSILYMAAQIAVSMVSFNWSTSASFCCAQHGVHLDPGRCTSSNLVLTITN